MGFSTVTTHAILFIAGIAVAAGLAMVFSDTGGNLISGVYDKADRTAEELKTDISIVHVDPGAHTKVYVINTGATVLDPTDTNLMINDTWIPDTGFNTSFVSRATNKDNSVWDPDEILVLNYTTTLGSGMYTAKVTVQKGVTDEYRFDK